MVGCKKMMSDAAIIEAILREPCPHPLTVSSLEMMWSPIRPNVDGIKLREQLLGMEKEYPHVQDEMIIVGVCDWTVAEEIQVLTGQFPLLHIF